MDPLAGFDEVTTIARGTRATVLRARDTTSGQRVAVKVLEGAADRAPDHAAFEREARALGAISRHPNVVTLHRAYLDEDGRPLLVLELCEGSLADRLAEDGPLTIRYVVAAGVALAGALETAHRAGIVHGDLSPRSVLVTRYGEVALADFGVAALRGAAAATSPHARRGVLDPTRAAPEILRGQEPTRVSDVHGLVATMWELLTGRPPYAAGEGPPSLTLPGTPVALRELLERSLSADPTRRPASPLELAQHLRTIEQASGWSVTPCRVGGSDGSWGSPLDAGSMASRRGRAAAMTGLPPLQLGTAPLDGATPDHGPERRRAPRIGPAYARRETEATPGTWRPPDPAVAREELPAPPSAEPAPPTAELPPPPTSARPIDLAPPASGEVSSRTVSDAVQDPSPHERAHRDDATHEPASADASPVVGPAPDAARRAPDRGDPAPPPRHGPHDGLGGDPDDEVDDRR